MKSLGKEPSETVKREYQQLGHRVAHTVWENLAEAVVSGTSGNGEMRRFLKCMYFEKSHSHSFDILINLNYGKHKVFAL